MNAACVRRLFPAVALSAALLLPAVSRGQERPVNVVMGDQFNNRVETTQLRGDVVVLVYAGRHGAEAAMELGRTLHTRFHPTADGAEPKAWSTQPVVGVAGWPAGAPVPDVEKPGSAARWLASASNISSHTTPPTSNCICGRQRGSADGPAARCAASAPAPSRCSDPRGNVMRRIVAQAGLPAAPATQAAERVP
jgi:hypothetical protein